MSLLFVNSDGVDVHLLYSPGLTAQTLHPLNVVHVLSNIVAYTLKGVSPALMVVRRMRSSSSRHHRSSRRHRDDTTSVADSLDRSRDSNASDATDGRIANNDEDVEGGGEVNVVPRYAHRRHHRGTAETRSRSAEVTPRSDAERPQGDVQRRSRSDESRPSSSRTAADDGSKAQAHMNTSFDSNRGAPPPHAPAALPPPPVMGKPPLSGRRAPQQAESTPQRRSSSDRHGDGSGRSSRRHRDGSSSSRAAQDSSTSAWGRVRHYFKSWDVTSQAYMLAHLLRALPVNCLHIACDIQRQVAALPMLRFKDEGTAAPEVLRPWAAAVLSSSRAGRADCEFGSCVDSTTSSVPPNVWAGAHFVTVHVALRIIANYLKGVFFLDASLVVRNLRSRRFTRRMLGWVMRFTSHAVLDPALLSVVATLICLSVKDFSPVSGPLKYTWPGLLRGLMCGCASVWLQSVAKRTCHWLINRGVVTVFDFMEYVVLRRYRRQVLEEDEALLEETDTDDEEEEEAAAEDDTASQASKSSATHHRRDKKKKTSSAAATSEDEDAAGSAALTAEQQVEKQRRQIARERRERRKKRQALRERREAQHRHAIMRAILYRIVAALVAHCCVQHPMSVAVELLRSRALMHATGLLSPYDGCTPADTISVESFLRFVASVRDGSGGAADADAPLVVRIIRQVLSDAGVEVDMLTRSIRDASGQAAGIEALRLCAMEAIQAGGRPSATESVELMMRSVLCASPLFYGVQFTAVDTILSFYLAVWTRLTKR